MWNSPCVTSARLLFHVIDCHSSIAFLRPFVLAVRPIPGGFFYSGIYLYSLRSQPRSARQEIHCKPAINGLTGSGASSCSVRGIRQKAMGLFSWRIARHVTATRGFCGIFQGERLPFEKPPRSRYFLCLSAVVFSVDLDSPYSQSVTWAMVVPLSATQERPQWYTGLPDLWL